jgi:hypothetical protein
MDFLRFGQVRPAGSGIEIEPSARRSPVPRRSRGSARRGPGVRAGLRKGDVIVKVGDRTVQSPEDVRDAAFFITAQDELAITVLREVVNCSSRCSQWIRRVPADGLWRPADRADATLSHPEVRGPLSLSGTSLRSQSSSACAAAALGPSISRNCASVSCATPSACASSSFEPAFSPRQVICLAADGAAHITAPRANLLCSRAPRNRAQRAGEHERFSRSGPSPRQLQPPRFCPFGSIPSVRSRSSYLRPASELK